MRKALALLAIILCTSTLSTAQNRLDSIAYRAMQVGQVMQQERVYLHFDNSAYYLGETMWFKAYVSFGADNRPSTLSKVLYVELVAPEGYVVETKKYKISDDGSCYGEFELNPLLLSGYYEIRAYTRYMLNWGKDAVFSRVFAVFDKVNADNWDFKNMLDRRRGFTSNGEWISAELPDATLDFFPEGGNLVAGMTSHVAYELRGKDGLFGEERITILEDGKPLLETTPQHLGKGSFVFSPKAGAKYRAEVTMTNNGKEKKYKFDLPEVEPTGVVMSVTENCGSIDVNLINNLPIAQELGFVVLHRGTMGYYRKFNTAGGNHSFSFAKDSLREGVNRAILFAGNAPLAERQFFVMHDTLQTNDHGTVRLNVTANGGNPNDITLTPHQKVTIKVSREDGKPITDGSDLSLAVSDAIGKQTTSYSHNMYTYLLLGSELKGYLPDAAQYFDPDNGKRKEQLDLIMLTHGWTSYDWSKLTREEIGDFQPIERGITIKGKFFLKTRSNKFGSIGKTILTPQKDILTRFDIATDGNSVQTSTFRTDSTGSFVLETDEFYGTRVASLKPQNIMRQSGNISYQFALDRYYSPGFRLYDYWENHLGKPMGKSESDSLVKLNPFEFMLSSFEVVAKKSFEQNSRPPHSEMRFNYLDEWEYAQDITYLDMFNTYEDDVYKNVKTERIFEGDALHDSKNIEVEGEVRGFNEAVENDEIISLPMDSTNVNMIKYVGSIRYGSEGVTLTVDHDFDHSLTASDVVLSAMRRHNYNWAYWVQLMVVLGEYSPNAVPEPDKEYLRGLPDADKMTNFKEFVIRSDEKTRLQFENRETHWTPLGRMLDNKIPLQKFYLGFLSQSYLYSGNGADGCPDVRTFLDRMNSTTGISYPMNPNYVACLIPYSEEERKQGVVPEFASPSSTMRYTSVQGYSESKRFYSPDYGRMKPQEQDYRRTLHWAPEIRIENGEAVVEFYNSSCCSNIVVDVTGRNAGTIFSNDDITLTREALEKKIRVQKESGKEENVQPVQLDSATLAACAFYHERAMIYYNQKRYKDAITMFAELVQYQYAPSLYYVGLCYLDGTGLTKNDQLAYKFISNAAATGYTKAVYDQATMLENGIGTETDKNEAHMLFTKAADLEEPRALVEMAHRCLEGRMVTQDKAMAEELLRKGAAQKHPVAMYEYGKLLHESGRDGIAYIEAAAATKNIDALMLLFGLESNAGNDKKAYQYAKELHQLGNHHGTKAMADCYYNGKGTSRDKGLAKDLYREAANAGNEEAKEILKKL